MELNERIKYLLQFNGQLQKDLAKACKVNETTVSHWVRRKHMRLTINHLMNIANFLGVTISELTGSSPKFDELLQRYADGLFT